MSDLWIILTGCLVAISCGILGCFLILRRMAMIGDAISHAVLPGIVIAFLFSGSRDSLWMLLGASLLGLLTVFLIQMFQNSGIPSDASIGVVFTALFAVGVLLVSLYTRHLDFDLDCVLYGEIAFVPFDRLSLGSTDIGPRAFWGLLICAVVVLTVIFIFYKQFKICAFDPALAAVLGLPVAFFHYLLMGLVSVTTVASFESVGAILVVGLLVVPPATAYLLTEKLSHMIALSVGFGMMSAIGGYGMAYWLDASIAGCMVCVAGILFVLAFLFSPKHGIVMKWWNVRKKATSFHSA